jgi:DNA-binding winged helix-turn-helix (wHTH) protein
VRDAFFFPPFRLEVANKRLWRGAEAIPLRRKTFAVLHCLVEHAGQLVTKDQLLETVWAGTYVSDTMPALCIRELRQALGDGLRRPGLLRPCTGGGIGSSPP